VIPRRIIPILLLAFAIVVGFYNALQGEYRYCFFIVPFAIASFTKSKIARIAEIAGLALLACHLMAAQSLYVGITALIVATILLFLLGVSRQVERIFIYCACVVVFACSYTNPYDMPGYLLGAGLDASLYLVVSLCLHIALDHYKSDAKNDAPLDKKYLSTLEKARDTAREAVNLAKEGSIRHG